MAMPLSVTAFFLRIPKLQKAIIGFIMPSVCVEQLGFHWMDIHVI